MAQPQPESVDMVRLFSDATAALETNREALNAADEKNHDHGDNMVRNFQVITAAMAEKPDEIPAEQLAYAGQVLGQESTSGSGQMYAQNLTGAAEQLGGQQLTAENAIGIIGAIMGAQPGSIASSQAGAAHQPDLTDLLGGMAGGGEPAAGKAQSGGDMGDLLGGLLGGLAGGGGGAAGKAQTGGGLGGLLGGLLGGMQGGQGGVGQTANPPGLDMNDLLAMGAGYLHGKQQGKSDIEAITGAILAGSGQEGYRQKSGQIVLDALLKGLGGMGGAS